MTLSFITPYSVQIGVVGAGTMGSGIALAALQAGLPVSLYDVDPQRIAAARDYIEKHLARKKKSSFLSSLSTADRLEVLAGAGVVIEAAPEDLVLKRDLFSRLEVLCPSPAILATNTSTLAVTAIAAAVSTPERVAGMHFFNPAPVLPLVEVVRGARTSPDTVQSLLALAERMEKTAVVVRDTPGFIVNRVARPFYGEALRMLGEGAATAEQIDWIARQGGGFRMGPFELMDLIGIDINFTATQSMYEQTFGEPRYRPHLIQAQMVQQGSLGRKTGRGFYPYPAETASQAGEVPESEPRAPRLGNGQGRVYFAPGSWAPGMIELARQAGYTPTGGTWSERAGPVMGVVPAGQGENLAKYILQLDRELPPDAPILCQCADVTLTEVCTWLRHPERLVGFDGLFFANGPVATLVPSPTLTPAARDRVESFVGHLGRLPVWILDSPTLVLPRIIAMLANEAAFAVQDGVAEAEKIDLAMRLGVNYPRGPLTWAKNVGYAQIVALLDHLHQEFREDRYRAAPLLRRWARLELVDA